MPKTARLLVRAKSRAPGFWQRRIEPAFLAVSSNPQAASASLPLLGRGSFWDELLPAVTLAAGCCKEHTHTSFL